MVSAQLWQANQALAQACLEHPFVQGIGNGTLARHKFAFYVGQDAFFLEAFARAYSIAAAKAPDWEGFSIFHDLANGVLEELRLHESYATAWGVDLHNIEPQPATRRYTDFLLATAWGSDIGLITAAMSPCMCLYAYLGQQLGSDSEHSYIEWIRTYSSPEFGQLAAQLESLSDRYTNTTPLTHSTYRYAMLCERDFFQAGWEA
ncbi:TenA family protein [Gloeocapsopsis dulcis]|uniref:TenA family transcriptional regulator n=1 Tax=Gloeocapsopsis dulcis AAB1 = 1H9 TaxID=1433147 RepID=A0A6N8G2W0_9CHRO|nr:TenA family protein [Gloeocapsopsis dulcis]MUL39491.1 TenA family transcriptional regulator [Gloeocapsopsis dulcis AAB1 = 1H9]WNN87293.1 TenA family protein [Gloeocapsopsis dulcis]